MSDLSTPKRGRPGYDRAAILEIAVLAFNEHGYDATSMGVLASRLNLSKAAIYHHFSSKEELLQFALNHALGGLEELLLEPAATTGPAIDRLSHVLRGAVLMLADRLPYVTLLLRVRGNSPTERDALTRRKSFDRSVALLVSAARDAGSLRADIDPATVTRLLFGMVNSLTEWYQPTGPADAAHLADDVLALALNGLRTPSTSRE
ncbi:TetR/AcrR family transcriptional regulator [Cryobacterium melibiosiphilum]|uniref:TetR/AcrR family transcriptional regulator n=1 Tax=Cryobacterium melibiosiphilum TaxID=995039 RepID=A0A3A5MNZ7_9MICO|nr:TetR/AcrR family transcriptional regulator [Cryobacterium melibiosiphilum]RJT89559.1 TetR/AcrR family transcriptional regulator [Cryobacterium melibiosiphilum]